MTAATALLAASSGRGLRRAALATAGILAGQLFTGWTNDVLDAELDRRAGRTDKPIATGELPAATACCAMTAALPAALVLSRAAGGRGVLLHGTGIVLAGAYNLGLNRTPLSFLPYAAAFGLLPAYALGEIPPAWTLAAGAVLGTAGHLGQVLPDIEADRRAGRLGLPQRLGVRRSAIGIAILMGACAAILSVATHRRATVMASAVGTAVAAGAAVAGLRGRPRPAFRLTMAAAGLLGVAYSLSLRDLSR